MRQKMATNEPFGFLLRKSKSDLSLDRIGMSIHRKECLISVLKDVIVGVDKMDTDKFGHSRAAENEVQLLDGNADKRQKDNLSGFQGIKTHDTASTSTASQNDFDRQKLVELTEMNLRWQKFHQKRDIQVKKYEKEIEELKAQIRNSTDSRGVVTFTEAQQKHIDSYCQRIRREGDGVRDELETALAEAQQQLAASTQQMEEAVAEAEQQVTVARQRKDEAVETARELQRQVEELNGQVASLTQETEELRGALVVTTRRHNHQPPPDQRLINNLKEKSRRYEQKYLNISKDYQKILHENTQLLAHLNERISGGNQRMPPGLFETIFNPVSTGEGPSSHQSSQSGDRNPEETRGEPTDPYEDIEVDSPVAISTTMRRSFSSNNRTRTTK